MPCFAFLELFNLLRQPANHLRKSCATCQGSALARTVQQSGAVEACWAHNPEVRRSKLRSASFNFGLPQLLSSVLYCQKGHLTNGQKSLICQGAHGVEPWTYRSAVDCSTTELYTHFALAVAAVSSPTLQPPGTPIEEKAIRSLQLCSIQDEAPSEN